MNALTAQFKEKAIYITRTTILMNAGSIATIDKMLKLAADEGVTLQEFLEVVDAFEDENIAEAKSLQKAQKRKADSVDSDSSIPEGLAELETMLRSMRESKKDLPDLDNENVQKDLACRGNAKAVKIALAACKEIERGTSSVDEAAMYANWKQRVNDALQAWVKVFANEHQTCLARLEQLTAAT